ncbi:hypothetical protein OV079_50420 [Nannocystis pusilla]|uniref:Uncharacterized protein n=1 Tax=Nannocystis pusilla TaxID=889268 RepID=A0A9X3F0A2_9BACT|nr:hypothetical protein [Nannocystis pusilla]MCY1013613.1 hypothetical protein [Nannocystis pusilla]
MSDFHVMRMLGLLYGHGDHPALSPALWRRLEATVLDFKYSYVDPTPAREVDGAPVVDAMWYWSENHDLVFRACEYLAGQRYPDRVFSTSGLTGAEHMARARGELLRWIDTHARWGFVEWHSDVYYNLDLQPLLMLAEWAEDRALAERAIMALDLLWLDIATHLHRGNFGATHGRSYIKDKAAAELSDSFDGARLLFADTDLDYADPTSYLAGLLVATTTYALPWTIHEIARDDAPMLDRERMNIPLDETPPPSWGAPVAPPPHGLRYDEAALPIWWAMNGFTAWPLLPLTLTVAEEHGLWDSQFADLAVVAELVDLDQDPAGVLADLYPLYDAFWRIFNVGLLKEVHTTTYRTEHYMLSSALDYRPGLMSDQVHPWQATLDERAVVFTQHPSRLPPADDPGFSWHDFDEPGPGYWTGEASLPRVGQDHNVGVILYAPQFAPRPLGLDDFDYRDETHAYFPTAHFDEVVRDGQWTLGRRGDGYVALFSHRPTAWREGQPEVHANGGRPFDLVAEGGPDNAWIVELGDRATSGSFAEFRAKVVGAEVVVTPVPDADGDGFDDGFAVRYDSPSRGLLTFGWHEPLVVADAEVPLRHDLRLDNPFVRADFDDPRYEVVYGDHRLRLDFTAGSRSHTPARRALTGPYIASADALDRMDSRTGRSSVARLKVATHQTPTEGPASFLHRTPDTRRTSLRSCCRTRPSSLTRCRTHDNGGKPSENAQLVVLHQSRGRTRARSRRDRRAHDGSMPRKLLYHLGRCSTRRPRSNSV